MQQSRDRSNIYARNNGGTIVGGVFCGVRQRLYVEN
jgi:hypothetical protein